MQILTFKLIFWFRDIFIFKRLFAFDYLLMNVHIHLKPLFLSGFHYGNCQELRDIMGLRNRLIEILNNLVLRSFVHYSNVVDIFQHIKEQEKIYIY